MGRAECAHPGSAPGFYCKYYVIMCSNGATRLSADRWASTKNVNWVCWSSTKRTKYINNKIFYDLDKTSAADLWTIMQINPLNKFLDQQQNIQPNLYQTRSVNLKIWQGRHTINLYEYNHSFKKWFLIKYWCHLYNNIWKGHFCTWNKYCTVKHSNVWC